MKRKTSQLPTRIYSYGVRFPDPRKGGPMPQGWDVYMEQLRAAARYRNTLVAIERTRREAIAAEQRGHGDIGPLTVAAEAVAAECDALADAIKRSKSGGGKPTPEVRKSLADAKARRKAAWTAVREAKVEQRGNADLKAGYQRATDESRDAIRRARATCGVYWGTYLQVEASAEAAAKSSAPEPPRFVRFDGQGRVAVQIQGGMTVDELHGCEDTRLRIARPAVTARSRAEGRVDGSRAQFGRTVARIRIGSNADRSPVWLDVPMIMHRPLPADGVIKGAWLLRRRVGLGYEYRLQIQVEATSFLPPPAPSGEGAIAYDLAWRRMPDGRIRAAYWMDSTGDEGSVFVPESVERGLEKVRDLRSIRDKRIDEMRAALVAWLASHREAMPDDLRDLVTHVHQWRAARKFVVLRQRWHEGTCPGDESILAIIDAWAKQDRHLLAWEANQRDRMISRRRESWCVLAAQAAQRYATIIVEDFSIPDVPGSEVPAPDDGDPRDGRKQRKQQNVAAPGELRDCLVTAAAKYGARLVRDADATRYSSRDCSTCGHRNDSTAALIATCGGCGAEYDQDANACRNLLARCERDGHGPDVLSRSKVSEYKAESGGAATYARPSFVTPGAGIHGRSQDRPDAP